MLVWAVVGAVVALPALSMVTADARVIVGAASVLGPLAAAGAAVALQRQRDRLAGALLLVSALTPTYFAWVLNVPALVVGVMLLVAPHRLLRHDRSTRRTVGRVVV
jgi:hypothetical protein